MTALASSSARRAGLRIGGVLLSLAALVVILACLRAGMGARPIAPATILQAILAPDPENFEHQVVIRLRLARVLGAIMTGAALGLSGLILQSLLHNPLGEPHVLGLNAGASLAVVIAVSLPAAMQPVGLTLPLIAALGAGVIFALVLVLASAGRTGMTLTKVTFCGIAMSAMASSISSTILILSEETLQQMRFWLVGDLAGVTYRTLRTALPLMLVAALAALWLGPKLNALALGDASAIALGVPVQQVRLIGLGAAALLCGAAVSIAGPVGFVGLVVPAIARRLAQGNLTLSLPCSALAGAALLLAADIAAGSLGGDRELATGIMTALVGAPVFIAIVARMVR